MLRNIIIIGATSGLVLFSKEFSNSISQPRMVGSLITAIIEFGQQTTGMGVCYIELSSISVAIVANEDAKIVCALFYDREDGALFGRLICGEILKAFTQEYSSDFTQYGRNLKDFYGFQKKIGSIVRFSPKPILLRLAALSGISKVLLVNDRDVIDAPSMYTGGSSSGSRGARGGANSGGGGGSGAGVIAGEGKLDQLSVLANLNALIDLCHSMMSAVNDSVQHVAFDTDCHHSILLWRIQERSVLVVAVDTRVPRDSYFPRIEEALELIEQGQS